MNCYCECVRGFLLIAQFAEFRCNKRRLLHPVHRYTSKVYRILICFLLTMFIWNFTTIITTSCLRYNKWTRCRWTGRKLELPVWESLSAARISVSHKLLATNYLIIFIDFMNPLDQTLSHIFVRWANSSFISIFCSYLFFN